MRLPRTVLLLLPTQNGTAPLAWAHRSPRGSQQGICQMNEDSNNLFWTWASRDVPP